MIRTLTFACLLAGLTACGDEQAAQTPAVPAADTATPSAAMSPPAPATPAAPAAPATADDDAISYDPIDVTKLDNAWWRQYSAGG